MRARKKNTEKQQKNYSDQNTSDSPLYEGAFCLVLPAVPELFVPSRRGYAPLSLFAPELDIPAPYMHLIHVVLPEPSPLQQITMSIYLIYIHLNN